MDSRNNSRPDASAPAQSPQAPPSAALSPAEGGSQQLLQQRPERSTMRLICFNVNSWPPTAKNAAMSVTSATALSAAAAASKPAQARATSAALARWLSERLDADVLCLQETKVSERKLAEIKELAVLKGYESFWSCSRPPRTGYSGTAIFCRSPKWSPTRCAEEEVLPATHIFDHIPGGEAAVEALGLGPSLLSPPSYEGEGRFLEVELGEDLTLINVYVPNAGDREADGGVRAGVKVAFLRALRRRVDEILAQASKEGKNRGVVLCGDLNLAAAREDVCLKFDFDGLYSPEEMSALRALMAPPMVDAFRRLHPEATAGSAEGQRGFTVWDQRSNARSRDDGLRIDFFLVSDNLRLARCEVVADIPWPWSDHAALLLEIEEAPPEALASGGGGATAAAASSAAAGAPPSSPPAPPSPPPSSSLASRPLLVRPPPPHEPVPQSSIKHPRWQPDPRQPTIAALFGAAGKKRVAGGGAVAAEAAKKKKEEK